MKEHKINDVCKLNNEKKRKNKNKNKNVENDIQ